MTVKAFLGLSVSLAVGFLLVGCDHAPGRPGPGPQVLRPEQQLNFGTLYQSNCAGCHGSAGKQGPAIALANPVYLALAGEDTLKDITARGIRGSLMPAFAKSSGGMLTDQQIQMLATGMMQAWGRPNAVSAQDHPPYKAVLTGDPMRGRQQFAASCSGCHGVDGIGTQTRHGERIGPIVDPSYLAIISDQGLRSFILAGLPDEGMPDWRSDSTSAMTDQQITDIVAWMASQRGPGAGQPYSTHP